MFLIIVLCLAQLGRATRETCDIFTGEWVRDHSYSSKNDYSSSCTFINRIFDCHKYGRPDQQFLRYRWQPSGCDLPRFDAIGFLRKMQGKKIMFVGDSITFNHYNSLICILQAAVPNSNIFVTFNDYGVTVMADLNHFLVDIQEEEKMGRVLKLDSISHGDTWKQMDVLVFNTGLWWYVRGSKKGWDRVQYGSTIVRDMDRNVALATALTTWRRWFDSTIDTSKTTVFFEGIFPVHYHGIEWGKPERKNCSMETIPLKGSRYPGRSSSTVGVVEGALRKVKNHFHFLNVTTLSELRIDVHPGTYNSEGAHHGMDCGHWCMAGVPDTWNQLLYSYFI